MTWTIQPRRAVLETTLGYPHHLAFFNVAAGSIDGGPALADDSNIDWGLDIPALVHWQRENAPAATLRIFPLGMSLPHAYGLAARPMTANELEAPTTGIYAISIHNLVRMSRVEELQGKPVDWLRRYQRSARVGASIYVYDFRGR